jgi:hypothetical protein
MASLLIESMAALSLGIALTLSAAGISSRLA